MSKHDHSAICARTKHHDECDGHLMPKSDSLCKCECHVGPPPTDEEVNVVTEKLLAMTLELNRIEDTMEDAW